MPTRTQQVEKDTAYFVTFTCYNWLNLIEVADAYGAFYRWFAYLRSERIPLLSYVIMPNHFHGIIFLPQECEKSINGIIGNGKRFIAYDIIKSLQLKAETDILKKLSMGRTELERTEGSKHRVFIKSFDAKRVFDQKMMETKLNYIHRNPCQKKWMLVDEFIDYEHSSAPFYEKNEPNEWLSDYRDYC